MQIAISIKKDAGTEVEILLDKEKPLLNNGYLMKLIGMEGRLLRYSVLSEIYSVIIACGKRPWNGNQFCAQQKNSIFLTEKNAVLGFCPSLF